MKQDRSKELYNRAQQLMPGGVNSPVRAFKAVGGTPLFFKCGSGSHVWDEDGNEYIDFVGSWGPLILGHAHPDVVKAIQVAAEQGTTFGAPCEAEIRLASKIRDAIPSMQKLRLVSSGTEAAMSALRVARGFTGKNHVIKFEGCYHGHVDSLLTAGGSGLATFDLPDSEGVPPYYSHHTVSVAYNDIPALEALPAEVINETAAIILEPIAANMGLVPPKADFLQALRKFTRDRGILLIFDEVITGFRVLFGGVQSLYGIEPDLTILGKIVGGGMPLAAYGGRADIMDKIAPLGPVYQAGTLSGNPVAAAAGSAALTILREENPYETLKERTTKFLQPVRELISRKEYPASISQIGSMWTIFFRKTLPSNFKEAKESDTSKYSNFFWQLLDAGVYTAPSQFETNFVSTAHSEKELEQCTQKISKSLSNIFENFLPK
ncbi:MAG TPA: glutamate-1-semialdehyde 2,1-aminomutase [Acidobacteriota bacterium]|nr:glutamate-1-semialdehyde 2,1-aminomutase [Acidobacteriota bacterium]